MPEQTMICPQCGQKNTSNKNLAYCSFCYSRFDEPEKKTEAATQKEVTTEASHTPAESGSEPSTEDSQPTPEAPVAPPKVIDYTDVICPFCNARTPHEATICPECNHDLTNAWL